jgi:hypothetical protein
MALFVFSSFDLVENLTKKGGDDLPSCSIGAPQFSATCQVISNDREIDNQISNQNQNGAVA